MTNANQFLIYTAPNGAVRVDVLVQGESVWLTDKIESKLQKGEIPKLDHLRAFRMSKEEIIYNWLQLVGQVARTYFITLGKCQSPVRS